MITFEHDLLSFLGFHACFPSEYRADRYFILTTSATVPLLLRRDRLFEHVSTSTGTYSILTKTLHRPSHPSIISRMSLI